MSVPEAHPGSTPGMCHIENRSFYIDNCTYLHIQPCFCKQPCPRILSSSEVRSPQHQQQSVPGSKTSTGSQSNGGRLQLSENINTLLASSFLSRWVVTPVSHDGLGQVQISNWGLPFLTFFRPTFNKILIRLDFDSILNNFQIRAPDKPSSCGSNLKLRVLCPVIRFPQCVDIWGMSRLLGLGPALEHYRLFVVWSCGLPVNVVQARCA